MPTAVDDDKDDDEGADAFVMALSRNELSEPLLLLLLLLLPLFDGK
jgi:hypothetical protein